MRLTVKEMEALCVFHAGSLSETLDALRFAEADGGVSDNRMADIRSLIDKLSRMSDGEVVCLDFAPAD